MVTCDQQEKVLSRQKLLLWIILQIINLIWRYDELNRLLVGSCGIPLNLKLQQDDHTVCKGLFWMTCCIFCHSKQPIFKRFRSARQRWPSYRFWTKNLVAWTCHTHERTNKGTFCVYYTIHFSRVAWSDILLYCTVQ